MKIEKEFMAAYDKHVSAIYNHVFFRVNSQELAQDLVQEVFFKAWRQVSSGERVENYKAYFYRIATNLVIDFYRQKEKTPLFLVDVLADKELQDEKSQSRMKEFESRDVVEKMVAALEPEEREILFMFYVDGLSAKEIAGIKQKTSGNISVIVHRAIKKLKEKYAGQF